MLHLLTVEQDTIYTKNICSQNLEYNLEKISETSDLQRNYLTPTTPNVTAFNNKT